MEELNKFIKRVDAATKSRSKDLRLNITEAQAMVSEIALLLSKENELLNRLTQQPAAKADEVSVEMDGGQF